MLDLTEFRPWQMLDARSLRVTAHFLAGFVPPLLSADFLALVARETWRTVAIATAGVSLALLRTKSGVAQTTRSAAVFTLKESPGSLTAAGSLRTSVIVVWLRNFPVKPWQNRHTDAAAQIATANFVEAIYPALGFAPCACTPTDSVM